MATINNNIANTTFTQREDSIYTQTLQITIMCDSGYKFDEAPKAVFNTPYGYPNNKTFTLNEDGTTATTTLSTNAYDGAITLTGTAVADTPAVVPTVITNNIANTTDNSTQTDNVLSINVACNSGYIFSEQQPPRYVDTSSGYPAVTYLDVAADKKSATKVVNDPPAEITLAGQTEVEPNVNVVLMLTNCTANDLPAMVANGATVDITLTADTDNIFRDTESDKPRIVANVDGMPVITYFNVSGATATLSYVVPDNALSITINAVAYSAAPPVTGFGGINIYKVDETTLNAFAGVRFTTGEQQSTVIDLGSFVSSLRRFFVPIATSGNDVLKCGNYNTLIPTETPAVTVVHLDFGGVMLPAVNGNSTDFESGFKLFLPFHGYTDLDGNLAGKPINLECLIDIVSGVGYYRWYTDGVLIGTQKINPYTDVVYRTTLDGVNIGDTDFNSDNLLGIEPFVCATTFAGLNNSGRNTSQQRAIIGDFSGFCVFSDVSLALDGANALSTEISMIKRLLENGVYIE